MTEAAPSPSTGSDSSLRADKPADAPERFDLVIVGAGPVGLALATALLASGQSLRIALLDRRAAGAGRDDPRALALAAGSRQILQRLGAWPAAEATPIREIHVSQRGGFGRTLIDASDAVQQSTASAGQALGHVLRYGALVSSLEQALTAASTNASGGACLSRHAQTCVTAIKHGAEVLTLSLRDAQRSWPIEAALVAHAEGVADAKDIEYWGRNYRQVAIVAEVTPSRAHGGRAWERFTGDGPLALLPLGRELSLVYTTSSERAPALLALDDTAFLATLRADFGGRLDFAAISPRVAFPLALRARRQTVGERQVWIGAAAQNLHPVAGQGFNLGLRDAWVLADEIATAFASTFAADEPSRPASSATGAPPDVATCLARYQRRRRSDRLGTIAFTDGLLRVFSLRLPAAAAVRGAALLALDLLPALRRPLARRLAQGAIDAPARHGN
ncbi:FAD-dependent monooxygenase [Rhodocyclus tenuis]|uniref:FAD-dependent monooxygenase n=1 Tax=Rhodocyclus tenuis TaxID=1066 RepID=UPI0019056AE9|nr:hypothetical protein [Rhodocyclus tenuis]